MSHIVEIKTEVRDKVAITAAGVFSFVIFCIISVSGYQNAEGGVESFSAVA